MRCPSKETLYLFANGACSWFAAFRIRLHLKRCAECNRRMDVFKKGDELLTRLRCACEEESVKKYVSTHSLSVNQSDLTE